MDNLTNFAIQPREFENRNTKHSSVDGDGESDYYNDISDHQYHLYDPDNSSDGEYSGLN